MLLDQYDSAVWFTLMEPKLRRYVHDEAERLEILKPVYCETHRPGVSLLPPGLVMAVLEVESDFDRWAVSGAGAVGLMQVMPFWPERLGMHRYELTHVAANLQHGLRHPALSTCRYTHDDVRRALERYNGSIGRTSIPTACSCVGRLERRGRSGLPGAHLARGRGTPLTAAAGNPGLPTPAKPFKLGLRPGS